MTERNGSSILAAGSRPTLSLQQSAAGLLFVLCSMAIASDGTSADGVAGARVDVPPQVESCQPDHASGVPMRTRRVRDVPFDWVTGDLELAITERNFRITGRNDIGKGLRDRGHSGYPEFAVIHFCNLENARTVLDLDPAFVAQMPCRVAVHEAGGEVVVSMLLLPEQHTDERVVAFSRALNAQLCEIQDYAVDRH
jgi:uncharacterized protein (DUF302 family)